MTKTAATPHSLECCEPGRGPGFRRTPGCHRCEELTAGATARRPAHTATFGRKALLAAQRSAEIAAHNCATSDCGPVCTRFEW